MPSPETRIAALNIVLSQPPKSVANYVPVKQVGNMLIVSGQLCLDATGELVAKGVVGQDLTAEQAILAARACAINVLAQVRGALGSLDKVKSVVRLGGFVAAAPGFAGHAAVMNGASDLMVEVFGETGRHARSTVGVSSLPLQAAVEVEAQFEIA